MTQSNQADGGPLDGGVRPDAVWDKERCNELEAFEKLLNEVGSINSGSHCLERIARCIDLAATLNQTDFDSGRMSFKQFLRALAIDDRFGKRA